MENATFNEIISSITQLNKEKKGLYKENLAQICRHDYNADPVKVTLDLQKCIKINILTIVKIQHGKDSHSSINDIEINQQTETDAEDTISFIDSMYEEMKYKILKEQLFKDIRLDVMNLIESLSKSSSKNADTDPTDISLFQQQLIQCKEKIVSLEDRLVNKDKISYFLSQNISSKNTQNLTYNETLSWLPETDLGLTNTEMKNINQSNDSTNTARRS